MGEVNWYEDPKYLPDKIKTLQEAEATYALREAWHKVYGQYPSDKSLGVLWAKSALETGRWKSIHCYNFGNIKKKRASSTGPDDGHFFTMFRCGEIINGKNMMFDPPHYQTHFRAYKTVADGAEDYIRFVSQKTRYKKAWQKVIEGDPKGYAYELKIAGYYTASLELYTSGVVRLFNEFMKRKQELMSWEHHDTEPAPPPPPSMPDVEEEIIMVTVEEIKTIPGNTIPESIPPSNRDTKVSAGTTVKTSDKNILALVLFALGSLGIIISSMFQSCG